MLKRVIWAGAPLALLMSCSSNGGDDDAELTGTARFAIVQVPTDVRCVRLTAQGNRTVEKLADLTPGQASTLSLNQLPVGQVTFNASTYASACSAVTAASVPTWLAEPAVATLATNTVVDVTLKLKRNGRANVNLDFDDGPSCGAVGASCASNTDCCSPATCTGGACVTASGGGANCTAAVGNATGHLTQLFTLTQPVSLKSAPGDATNVYIVERTGRIRVGAPTSGATPTVFLDITAQVNSTGGEQGLLGVAFHPSYATNGRFFVHYTNPANQVVVAEYHRSAGNPNVADSMGPTVLSVSKPQNNHNGGALEFGPDGFLYIGIGDGGGANDPMGNAQNKSSLLGKVLRIDVATLPYTSPPNLSGGLPEVWDWGLRNPWRLTFDACTGDMYLADEGQSAVEEINVEPANTGRRNYGWATMEGNQCVVAGCNTTGLTTPTYTYPAGANGNCAVIGGYVYRGSANPGLRGRYVYGDYCSGRIWSVTTGGMPVELAVTGQQITSFGQDSKYELYVLSQSGGVYRLDP